MDPSKELNENGALIEVIWTQYLAACAWVALFGATAALTICCRRRTWAQPGSTSHDGSQSEDWRSKMKRVRFQQQLKHWAAGNAAFRAARAADQEHSRARTGDDLV